MSANHVLPELKAVLPEPIPELWGAITSAGIADEYMKETAKILSQWNTEQVGKLSLPRPMMEQYIKIANSLANNLQFFKSCISVNVLTKIVGDKKVK
jgi:hypothetical protein